MHGRIINSIVFLALCGLCCSGRDLAVEKRVSVDFQDEYVITSVDTGPKHLLVTPYRMALDGQKRLYVLDLKESDVKVFDEKGHLVRVIGRLGEGPGELDAPSGIAIRGNELAVSCTAARRLTFFDVRDGSYLRMIRMAESFSDFRLDSKGNLYADVTDPRARTVKFQKYDSDLRLLKTFVTREWFPPNWFQTGDWIDVRNDDTLLYAHPLNHEYKILVFDAEGNIVDTIRKDFVPVPIFAEDRAEVEGMMKNSPKIDGFFDRIPNHYEPFYAMFADDAGRIFVQTRIRRNPGVLSWDVFSREGEFLCSFDLAGSEPNSLLWRNNRVYSRGEDADGNPTIRVRKIIWKD
ncbi:MAG: 6-bladed beta-propeller [Candidatus Aminicenantes bacterium]|nr:6-bladed beta-propeller [Candidatus Aminicenantes bacterium]